MCQTTNQKIYRKGTPNKKTWNILYGSILFFLWGEFLSCFWMGLQWGQHSDTMKDVNQHVTWINGLV